MASKSCFICNKNNFNPYMKDIIGSGNVLYTINKCQKCGVGLVDIDVNNIDYSEYGDHLENNKQQYFEDRLKKVSIFKKILFFYIKTKFSLNAKVLDFGSGAGFFIKSIENAGFANSYAVEISDKLKNIAINKLKVSNQYCNINEINEKFDVIAMLDVIEHLPIDIIKATMEDIVDHMKKGGVLLGTTPNFRSLNIKLFKDKDPVIAPPSHVIYFTKENLDSYMRSLGLKKRMLLVTGFSTNSFFRKSKFEPSWVEKPKIYQKPLAILIKLIFKLIGILLIPFGLGYHIYFIYEK